MIFRDEHDQTFSYQSRVDKALIDGELQEAWLILIKIVYKCLKIRYETIELIRSLWCIFEKLNKFDLFEYGFDLTKAKIQARIIFHFESSLFQNRLEKTGTVNRSVDPSYIE